MALPTNHSAKIALRTQQIIAYESEIVKYIDPLGNSNQIEALTEEICEKADKLIKEIGFTFANAIEYVQLAIDQGQDPNLFGRRLSFFFNSHNGFLEEVAKFRAARKIWAKIMKERFKVKDEKAMHCRFHVQTGGSTLTAQQVENNIVRTTIQALAAVLGGAQSLHTNAFDLSLIHISEPTRPY